MMDCMIFFSQICIVLSVFVVIYRDTLLGCELGGVDPFLLFACTDFFNGFFIDGSK